MSAPSKPPLLRRNGLTGRVYIITRYHTDGDSIVADRKFDVTEDYQAIAEEDYSQDDPAGHRVEEEG